MLTFEEPVILLNLARSYKPGMSNSELDVAAKGDWQVDIERSSRASYAIAVCHGRILAVYRPERWEFVRIERSRKRFRFYGERDELKKVEWVDGDVSYLFGRGIRTAIRYQNC